MTRFHATFAILLLAVASMAGCVQNADLAGASRDQGSVDDASDRQPSKSTGTQVPAAWPDLEDAVIRPGVHVNSCTGNFIFRSTDNSTLYIGTAAHCTDHLDIGDPVPVHRGYVNGTLVYNSWEMQERLHGEVRNFSNELAIVELPDTVRDEVHPAMLRFGGPTGIAEEVPTGTRVLAYGNSLVRPGEAPGYAGPREGYGICYHHWQTGVYFVGPSIPGDSGTPVLTASGEAIGLQYGVAYVPPGGGTVTNLNATLPYANERSNHTFELVTYPLLEDGMLPDPEGPDHPDDLPLAWGEDGSKLVDGGSTTGEDPTVPCWVEPWNSDGTR